MRSGIRLALFIAFTSAFIFVPTSNAGTDTGKNHQLYLWPNDQLPRSIKDQFESYQGSKETGTQNGFDAASWEPRDFAVQINYIKDVYNGIPDTIKKQKNPNWVTAFGNRVRENYGLSFDEWLNLVNNAESSVLKIPFTEHNLPVSTGRTDGGLASDSATMLEILEACPEPQKSDKNEKEICPVDGQNVPGLPAEIAAIASTEDKCDILSKDKFKDYSAKIEKKIKKLPVARIQEAHLCENLQLADNAFKNMLADEIASAAILNSYSKEKFALPKCLDGLVLQDYPDLKTMYSELKTAQDEALKDPEHKENYDMRLFAIMNQVQDRALRLREIKDEIDKITKGKSPAILMSISINRGLGTNLPGITSEAVADLYKMWDAELDKPGGAFLRDEELLNFMVLNENAWMFNNRFLKRFNYDFEARMFLDLFKEESEKLKNREHPHQAAIRLHKIEDELLAGKPFGEIRELRDGENFFITSPALKTGLRDPSPMEPRDRETIYTNLNTLQDLYANIAILDAVENTFKKQRESKQKSLEDLCAKYKNMDDWFSDTKTLNEILNSLPQNYNHPARCRLAMTIPADMAASAGTNAAIGFGLVAGTTAMAMIAPELAIIGAAASTGGRTAPVLNALSKVMPIFAQSGVAVTNAAVGTTFAGISTHDWLKSRNEAKESLAKAFEDIESRSQHSAEITAANQTQNTHGVMAIAMALIGAEGFRGLAKTLKATKPNTGPVIATAKATETPATQVPDDVLVERLNRLSNPDAINQMRALQEAQQTTPFASLKPSGSAFWDLNSRAEQVVPKIRPANPAGMGEGELMAEQKAIRDIFFLNQTPGRTKLTPQENAFLQARSQAVSAELDQFPPQPEHMFGLAKSASEADRVAVSNLQMLWAARDTIQRSARNAARNNLPTQQNLQRLLKEADDTYQGALASYNQIKNKAPGTPGPRQPIRQELQEAQELRASYFKPGGAELPSDARVYGYQMDTRSYNNISPQNRRAIFMDSTTKPGNVDIFTRDGRILFSVPRKKADALERILSRETNGHANQAELLAALDRGWTPDELATFFRKSEVLRAPTGRERDFWHNVVQDIYEEAGATLPRDVAAKIHLNSIPPRPTLSFRQDWKILKRHTDIRKPVNKMSNTELEQQGPLIKKLLRDNENINNSSRYQAVKLSESERLAAQQRLQAVEQELAARRADRLAVAALREFDARIRGGEKWFNAADHYGDASNKLRELPTDNLPTPTTEELARLRAAEAASQRARTSSLRQQQSMFNEADLYYEELARTVPKEAPLPAALPIQTPTEPAATAQSAAAARTGANTRTVTSTGTNPPKPFVNIWTRDNAGLPQYNPGTQTAGSQPLQVIFGKNKDTRTVDIINNIGAQQGIIFANVPRDKAAALKAFLSKFGSSDHPINYARDLQTLQKAGWNKSELRTFVEESGFFGSERSAQSAKDGLVRRLNIRPSSGDTPARAARPKTPQALYSKVETKISRSTQEMSMRELEAEQGEIRNIFAENQRHERYKTPQALPQHRVQSLRDRENALGKAISDMRRPREETAELLAFEKAIKQGRPPYKAEEVSIRAHETARNTPYENLPAPDNRLLELSRKAQESARSQARNNRGPQSSYLSEGDFYLDELAKLLRQSNPE